MNFKEWFFVENTVSQIIKQKYKEKYSKFIKSIGDHIKTWFTANHLHQSLSQNSIDMLTKWYSYNYFKQLNGDNPSITTYRSFFWRDGQSIVVNHKDYLLSQLNDNGDFNRTIKSKLNDTSFTLSDLDRRVDLWHFSLESKNRLPGAEGKTVLDLSNSVEPKNISLLGSEWSGWRWVDIEKGYCDKESKSMGHCGNSGSKDGDTILSLRDENNIPHLTFILNDGVLGEMKGRNNNKPSKKYHPAIVELLKLPIIRMVKGGGYRPENNFNLDDLDEEIKEKLLEFKPELEFDAFEDMEKNMEEIKKRYGTENWKFASEYSTVEDGGGEPVIHHSGSFHTFLKVKLLKNIHNNAYLNYDERDMINAIKDAVHNMWSIEDLDIEEEKNGISIKGFVYYENYGGSEIDGYEDFIHHLSTNVEPYEQEFKDTVQRILVEKGYIAPYYVKRATQETGKVNWSVGKFKNFDWNVNTPEFRYTHEIIVPIFRHLQLGVIENKNKNEYSIGNQFKEKLEKDLENELLKISKEAWNIESQQRRLFQTQKGPAYTEDMKIKPNINVSIRANRESYTKAWDPETNPVESFRVDLYMDIEISQVDTYKEAKKAERMLHFIDNNYELIKNRLINRFNLFKK